MMINLQNLFRKNLPAKILALIASVIMWGYVMNEENPAVNAKFTVPIEIVNAPEGYDVSMNLKEVTFKVRATRALMASVHENDFKAVIDLSGNTEGDYESKIKAVIPQGFELLGMSDDTVKVTMESLIAHGVPVDITVMGKAAQGMEVANVKPAQQYVNVYGPRHLVESISKVSGKIKLSDNTADFTMRVKLSAISSEGEVVNNLAVLPGELDVTVQLEPGKINKIVPVKPMLVGILPEGHVLGDVRVQPVQLELSGTAKVLDGIKSLDTLPVSLTGMTATTTQEVEVSLPEGTEASSKKVTLSIEIHNK